VPSSRALVGLKPVKRLCKYHEFTRLQGVREYDSGHRRHRIAQLIVRCHETTRLAIPARKIAEFEPCGPYGVFPPGYDHRLEIKGKTLITSPERRMSVVPAA
jgi:hypothetical protein